MKVLTDKVLRIPAADYRQVEYRIQTRTYLMYRTREANNGKSAVSTQIIDHGVEVDVPRKETATYEERIDCGRPACVGEFRKTILLHLVRINEDDKARSLLVSDPDEVLKYGL